VPLTVRDAEADDASSVRGVAEAAWHDTYAGLLSASTIETFIDRAYSIDRLQRRIDRDTFLVVEDGGSITAFADAVVEEDRLNLAAIYALPEQRGHGAGTLLLNELRARFVGLPVSADVLVGNRKGEVFYEHRGFVAGETIEEDLFGEPAIERRWWLDARLD
jgi:GNAT superfamily N-acetyltransferase